MKKFFLMSLVGLLTCLTAVGQQPSAGKYYRIVNQNPDKSIVTSGERYGYCITEDQISNALTASEQGGDTQYNQIWKFSAGKFQNALTLRYIYDVNGSTQAYTNTDGKAVTIEAKGSNFLIKSGNGQYLHADGGNAIVGWYDTNNASNWWNFEEVAVDEAAVKAAQDEYKRLQEEKASLMSIVNKANVYSPIVEGYFTSKGCTELKAEYAAMSDDAFKAKMTEDALPEQVQTMVLGIKNKWAGEFNPAMSQRFRVQSYKAYTRCNDAGTQANSPKWTVRASQMSDRNNPTGIWTDALQLLYVFVEDEIPAGTTLKIAGASGSGVIGLFDHHGTELHRGMNVIYSGLNYTTQWIMYTCAADYSTPVSSYPEIKIHIEGGEVLGYVNKTVSGDETFSTADEEATNAEYTEVLDNAMALMKAKDKDMSAINFTVMGERGVFEFPLSTYREHWSKESKWGSKIYKSLNFYDNVLKWEWSNMGWQDRVENGKADNDLEHLAAGGGDAFWPTYINNHAPTMQCPDGKNPYSGDSHTGMPGSWAVESSYNAERADFDTWCCGHESGHNNQSTINLPSCTESSNNFFSNVITTQYGYRLGRGWSFAQNFDAYGYGKTIFCQRDISITMRMWYNLWLYYHVAGHNKSFMPKLFKALRADLMSFGGEGWHTGKFGGANKGNATTSWLKFYEKACEAAGEDLTEYFRMWGFLTPTAEAEGDYIEVIDGKYYAYCGDYSSYYIHAEKADIDAAIARVKAHGWRENLEVMFMEDRQIPRKRHDPLATGNEYKPFNWGSAATAESMQAEYGNVGDVLTFIDGTGNNGAYTYILSGNHIKLTGTGGVGFIVYDKNNEVAYMANKFEFNIPAAVVQDGFTIKVFNADGTSSEVADKAESASDEDKLSILKEAVKLAKTYTAMEDATGKKVGYYPSEAIADLVKLVTEANNSISGGEVASYLDIAKRLNAEVINLMVTDPTTKITENMLYTIRSERNKNRYLASGTGNSAGSVIGGSSTSSAAKWLLVPANDKNDGTYYMQNRATGRYLNAILNEKNNLQSVEMTDGQPADKNAVKVVTISSGVFGVRPMDKSYVNIDPSNNIAVWGSADEGSQWTISAAGELEEPVTDEMITELVQKSNSVLADVVADVELTQSACELQCTDAGAANYISCSPASTSLSKAIDGKETTSFTTSSSASAGNSPHYLMVDLGERKSARMIQFDIIGKANFNSAKTVYVYGSSDATNWTRVATVTGEQADFHSPVVRTSGTSAYRYWRFDVMTVYSNREITNPYPHFTVVEFKLNVITKETVVKNDPYTSIANSYVTNLMKRVEEADGLLAADYRTTIGDLIVYEALQTAYNNLYERASAIDPSVGTGINDIEAEGASDAAIYDLSGRKVSNANRRGIYIRNGKKVLR